jgi:hypothetical protein
MDEMIFADGQGVEVFCGPHDEATATTLRCSTGKIVGRHGER